VLGASGGGTYLLGDNVTFGGDVALGQIDAGGPDVDFSAVGAEAEWMFTPGFSVSGRVDHLDVDGFDATEFRLGLNFDFGGESLADRAVSGASFIGGRRLLGILRD